MYRYAATKEAAWAITVATAAPVTPQRKTATNSRSSRIFSTEAINRKYSVAALSPTARSIAEKLL